MSTGDISTPDNMTADAIRLILYGPKGSGKTSLMESLSRCMAHSGEGRGRLMEVVSLHPVHSNEENPSPDDLPANSKPSHLLRRSIQVGERLEGKKPVMILDLDGAFSRHEILPDQTQIPETGKRFLKEFVDADALLLFLDVSLPESDLHQQLEELSRLLHTLRVSRGAEVKVGGFPVFLVLSKCDMLGERGVSAAEWMQAIEDRKCEVLSRFHEFLRPQGVHPADSPEKEGDLAAFPPHGGFGQLDFHVWATSTRRPDQTGNSDRSSEPYGVAELFRQGLEAGEGYRFRRSRSQFRLGALLMGLFLVLTLMAGLAGALFIAHANTQLSLYRMRVEDMRFLERGGPGERLRGTPQQLEEKLVLLKNLKGDPLFRRLSIDDQEFIQERMDETQLYLPYLEKLLAEPGLESIDTEKALDSKLIHLRENLALPVTEWESTWAGKIRRDLLENADALRRAVQALRNWYLDSSDQAAQLWAFAKYSSAEKILWTEWGQEVDKVLVPSRLPPFGEKDPIPGVRGDALTFAHASRFDRVVEARTTWESDRIRLGRLQQLCSALGFTPGTKDRPALLVMPSGVSLTEIKTRLKEIKTTFPDYPKAFDPGTVSDLINNLVRRTARRQYLNLLPSGQSEVLRHLVEPGSKNEETAAGWEVVQNWLKKPDSLEDWAEMARILLRLDNPSAIQPIPALSAFLSRAEMSIEIRSLNLVVPELRGLKPRAEARLILLAPATMRQPALAFEPSGEGSLDPDTRTWTFPYRCVEGEGRLAFRPGDKLWAEVPLRGGTDRLVWSQARSARYQFERLLLPPRIQPLQSPSITEGRILEDVRLELKPEGGVPSLPDLLPEIRPANR